MNTNKRGIIGLAAIFFASGIIAFGQTNLQFTATTLTDEQAIRLNWSSVSNELYEIDEADALIDTNTGSTTWNLLYNNYPSQGTNTFWLDTGNYNLSPQILHPKNMPMRFYRIVDLGADTTSDEPSVSITTPANNTAATGELTVNVLAQTDQPILAWTKLYVDGQEMRPAIITSNYTDATGVTNLEADTYTINTCEWGNGTHILFATTECESGAGDAVNSPPVATGHAVSKFVTVLFSNLVTRIAFSQPAFDPSSGQTQQVSAVFANNCNWTLTVRDIFSNEVRTVTGSGSSMLYNWDGTGDGETNLPTGVYYYYISAQTNGLAPMSMASASTVSGAAATASLASDSAQAVELWAIPPSSSDLPLPAAIIPPGMNTNGYTFFEATSSQEEALVKAVLAQDKPAKKIQSVSLAANAASNAASPQSAGAGGGSSANSQTTPAAPQRPPANPIEGISGLFGIAYDTFAANGTNGFIAPLINNVPGLYGSYIALDGYSTTTHLGYAPLPAYNAEANGFLQEMQLFGWKAAIRKVDDQLNINDLRGSGTPFNNVSLGVFMSHGAFGNTQDYQAGLCKQMYYPVTAGGSVQYLRLSEMNLGGSDPTNGLKWFAILACDSLHQANWNSMQSHGIHPYNNNLHMLIGANSVISTSSTILEKWAQYMNFGVTNNNPMTVHDAWYRASINAYRGGHFTNTMVMAIAYDTACLGDFEQQGFNSAPQGTWTYDQQQVWP